MGNDVAYMARVSHSNINKLVLTSSTTGDVLVQSEHGMVDEWVEYRVPVILHLTKHVQQKEHHM